MEAEVPTSAVAPIRTDPTVGEWRGRAKRASAAWWRRYTAALAFFDLAAVLFGALVAQQVRFGSLETQAVGPNDLSYTVFALVLMPAWLVTMTLSGTYERRYLESGSEEFRRVFGGALRFLGVVAVLALVLKIDVARGFVALAIPLATLVTLAGRYAARQWLHRRRSRRRTCMKRVLAVGRPVAVGELARRLRAMPFMGLAVVAACTIDGEGPLDVDGESIPVLGRTDAVADAATHAEADAIAVADDETLSQEDLRKVSWQLEGKGVELLVAPQVTDVTGPRISIRPVAGLPLVYVDEPELSGVRRLLKSAFDRVTAATALVVLLPVLLVIGVVVRLTSKGPALFKQVRVGLGGRPFVMWKFRTMSVDAEQRVAEVLHLNEHDGVLFKASRDPRVTPVGRFLRRWSLDELPQLWNVLRGEMSIVGPRPPLPTEVERYSDVVRRRLLVKPGLTGLWQVSGRAELPWDEAVRLDLHYVENWSPSLDLVILAKTVLAVARRHGAW